MLQYAGMGYIWGVYIYVRTLLDTIFNYFQADIVNCFEIITYVVLRI